MRSPATAPSTRSYRPRTRYSPTTPPRPGKPLRPCRSVWDTVVVGPARPGRPAGHPLPSRRRATVHDAVPAGTPALLIRGSALTGGIVLGSALQHTRKETVMRYGLALAAFFVCTAARADETCMSPYMPKITGQEDYVYLWTLGVEGVGDGSDKLVTVGANPADRASYGKVELGRGH